MNPTPDPASSSPAPPPPASPPPSKPNPLGWDVIQEEKLARRRSLLVAAAVVSLLIAGYIAARPIGHALKVWRAESLVTEGQRLLETNETEGAFHRARSALQLTPGSPEALRLAARALSAAGSLQAPGLWKELAARNDATDSDRIQFAEAALRLGDSDLAEAPIERLLAAPRPSPQIVRLAAQQRLTAGDLPGAIRHARELVRIEPTNPSNLLALATVLRASPDPASHAEARNLRWQVAEKHPDHRLPAFEALLLEPGGNTPDGTTDDAQRIAAALAEITPPTIHTRILSAEASIRQFPALRTSIARGQLASLEPADLREVLQVVAALSRHNEFEPALRHLPPDRSATNTQLFRLRIVCLASAGKPDLAYRELLDIPKSIAIDPLELELERFRIARKLPDSSTAREHQDRLVPATGNQPHRLRILVAFADAEGLADVALEACQRLVRATSDAPWALRRLVTLHERQGDTQGARLASRRLAERTPTDPINHLRAAHLDALLGDNLQAALSTSTPLFDHPSLGLDARLTAALAYFRLRDASNAVRSLGNPPPPGTPVSAAQAAVLVAVHALAGNPDKARTIASSIPLDRLRQEEKDLVRPFLPTPSPIPTPQSPQASP